MEEEEALSQGRCGVVMVATGHLYVEAAIRSARSVREHCREEEGGSPTHDDRPRRCRLPVHIWTDMPEVCRESGAFESVAPIENPHRRSKVDHLWRSPFERTLFLDADTRVVADISGLFRLLDRFDLCMAHAHRRAHAKSADTSFVGTMSSSSSSSSSASGSPPVEFPQLNSGVFLFRRTEAVVAFLKRWQEAFHAAALPKDQVTLRELLWASAGDLRMYVLPPEYNVRYDKYLHVWDEGEARPKILHMRKFIDELRSSTG